MDENQNNNQQISKHEIIITKKKNRRGLKVLLIILGVIILGGIAVGVLVLDKIAEYKRSRSGKNYVVFAETLNLVEKMSSKNGTATFEVVEKLPFATQVVLYSMDILRQDDKSYYLCDYYTLPDGQHYNCKKNYYLELTTPYDIVDSYSGEYYLLTFPLKETQQLPILLRHSIIEYLFDTNHTEFSFTQDVNRIGSSIVKADFNLDGADDYAIVMQYDSANSFGYGNRVLVMCYNPDLSKYYAVHTDYNSGLATIELFEKGSHIYIDSETTVKSPNIGIIYHNQSYETHGKYAIFYDPELKQFKQYAQMPLSQLYDYYEDEEEDYIDESYDYYSSDDEVEVQLIQEDEPVMTLEDDNY